MTLLPTPSGTSSRRLAVAATCPDCGHHAALHPGTSPTTHCCTHCELEAITDAARDQENALAAQAEELDGLLRELATERDKLAALRRQYEADLYEMRPILNAIRRGAAIGIGYHNPPYVSAPTYHTEPPTSTCGGPDEFRTVSDYHAPPRGYGIIP